MRCVGVFPGVKGNQCPSKLGVEGWLGVYQVETARVAFQAMIPVTEWAEVLVWATSDVDQ